MHVKPGDFERNGGMSSSPSSSRIETSDRSEEKRILRVEYANVCSNGCPSITWSSWSIISHRPRERIEAKMVQEVAD